MSLCGYMAMWLCGYVAGGVSISQEGGVGRSAGGGVGRGGVTWQLPNSHVTHVTSKNKTTVC